VLSRGAALIIGGFDRMHDATLLTTAGRDPASNHGIVNPPIHRASTILFPSVAAYESARTHHGVTYGRAGTPTTFAFEEAVAALEQGHRAIAVASGKAAINLTLAALLQQGDHLLMVDTAYAPTRHFCDRTLKRYGVSTTYYDPAVGAGIAELFRPETRLVFMEAPGSLTFEMQDVPAIAAAARARGIVTVMDNTWATPLLFKPLAHGVDVSVQAVTKYIGGHSDLMMGVVASNAAIHDRLRHQIYEFGSPASPEDCWLALRGLRTLAARLERHERSALRIAEWLAEQPEIERVLYPALATDPGHALWKRDFKGASGLFGVVLRPVAKSAIAAMVDGLELFGIGASWGGYESLCVVAHPETARTVTPWTATGRTLRLHIGLEDADDLLADLSAGLDRLRAAT
jgi:cystathionine beta-lyase